MRIRWLAIAPVVALSLGACASAGGGLEDELRLNDDPASVLLMVKDEGGFVPADFLVRQGPRMILLRDGTLITQGAMIEIFPAPLLIPYQQATLDDETILFVLEELDDLGFVDIVDEANNEAANFIADASTTVVTFFNQDGAHRFGVYALGIGDLGPGQQFTDTRVPQLANLISELETTGFSLPGAEYQPESIQVLAGIREFPVEPNFANVRDWPLPISYEEMEQTDLTTWRCATFDAEQAETLLAEFAQANQVTTWDDGTTEYAIEVRPLFPGEEPCAPLGPAA